MPDRTRMRRSEAATTSTRHGSRWPTVVVVVSIVVAMLGIVLLPIPNAWLGIMFIILGAIPLSRLFRWRPIIDLDGLHPVFRFLVAMLICIVIILILLPIFGFAFQLAGRFDE